MQLRRSTTPLVPLVPMMLLSTLPYNSSPTTLPRIIGVAHAPDTQSAGFANPHCTAAPGVHTPYTCPD